MPQSDEELVIKTLAGDIDSFGQLVRKYQGAVLGLAFNLVENFTDAQDIAQEAFIKAFQNLDQLKDYKRFAHWLNQITANTCHRFMRNRKRELSCMEPLHEIGEQSLDASITRPDELVERKERYQMTRQAMNKLSKKNRLVVTLYYMDGLSYREISEFLALPISTVKSRLYHARKNLREEISMVEETLEQAKPERDFTELIKYIKDVTPDVISIRGKVTDIERIEGPYYFPTRWKVVLDDKHIVQVKQSRDEKEFNCERRLLELLAEEKFPVPKLYFADESKRILFTEFVKGSSLADIVQKDTEIQRYASLAAEHIAILEDIHIRRRKDLEPLALKQDKSEPLDRVIKRMFEGTLKDFFRQTLSTPDLRSYNSLASQIVSDISSSFDILGVREVFPSFTIITEDGLKHAWLLTHIGPLTRESRLVWLFTTGLFWRGGAYRFFLTNKQVDVYLNISRKLGYEIDSENFRRRIDAHHLFWFLENYSWLVKQAKKTEKDERFVEWAKLHGPAKERMESMKSSFFESPILSNDKTYVEFRAILERYL